MAYASASTASAASAAPTGARPCDMCKSETEVAVAMTCRTDGVVDVVGNLAYRLDDARLRTEEQTQTMHGVADDWLCRL